jgi:hypothetical protein
MLRSLNSIICALVSITRAISKIIRTHVGSSHTLTSITRRSSPANDADAYEARAVVRACNTQHDAAQHATLSCATRNNKLRTTQR